MVSSSRSFLLFNLSGWLGTGLFYLFYSALVEFCNFQLARRNLEEQENARWATFAVYKASFCWSFSYFCSISWQHSLHRFLVFGRSAPYWRSLGLTYLSYSVSLAFSSFFNGLLTVYMGFDEQISFCLSLILTGLFNYFTVQSALEDKKGDQNKEKGKREKIQ